VFLVVAVAAHFFLAGLTAWSLSLASFFLAVVCMLASRTTALVVRTQTGQERDTLLDPAEDIQCFVLTLRSLLRQMRTVKKDRGEDHADG
jgi:hypothetical protein